MVVGRRGQARARLRGPMPLGHGTLLIMAGTTLRFRKHEVAKTIENVGERINLTFRFMGGV